jgi:hypothetical protein
VVAAAAAAGVNFAAAAVVAGATVIDFRSFCCEALANKPGPRLKDVTHQALIPLVLCSAGVHGALFCCPT